MSDARRIVVVGVGGRTPLGATMPASAAAVRAGIAAIADHAYMIDRFGLPMKVTADAFLPPDMAGVDRAANLALAAAQEALAPIAGLSGAPAPMVLLATGEPRPGQGEGHGAAVCARLCEGLRSEVALGASGAVEGGHAGGILALHHARQALEQGRAELCLAGGVDSWLEPDTLEWLDEAERLHSEGNIYGFCPGEAAGFCLLARADVARRLGLPVLLQLSAAAEAQEENRIGTETICIGEGLGAVFAGLAEAARSRTGNDADAAPPDPVDRILCDMNGERYRGNEYGFAVLRSTGLFRDAADFETPADCWGDVGAASGPLYVGLAAEARARNYEKGPQTLIWASSEGGGRAAALLDSGTGGAP